MASQIPNKLRDPWSLDPAALDLHYSPAAYPLSYGQRALWFEQKYHPSSAAYHIAFTARAFPRVSLIELETAFGHVIRLHPSLRTIFVTTAQGQPRQRVLPVYRPNISLQDASLDDEAALRARVTEDYRRPFLLGHPLLRMTVFRRKEEDVLLLTVHHLVFDARSCFIFFENLRDIYNAALKGEDTFTVARPRSAYLDFVQYQIDLANRPEGDQLWNFWKQALSGELPVLNLARPSYSPLSPTSTGESIPFDFSDRLSAALQCFARERRTTLFTLLLAAFNVLLHRFAEQNTIIVGTPVSQRCEHQWNRTIGYFVNLLPIRAQLSPRLTFNQHLANMRESVLAALAHKSFPFALMVDRLRLPRCPGRTPIFQALFNFLTDRSGEIGSLFIGRTVAEVHLGASALRPYVIPQQEGQFEIALEMGLVGGSLAGVLKYMTGALAPATAEAMKDAYVRLLEAIVSGGDSSIGELIER